MNLVRLIRTHLGPYQRLLVIVLILQAVQTAAALMLPTLNADLIDNGVLQGDNGYIWRVGAIMLGFSFVQIVFAVGAVRYGARAAMSFGRDVRRDIFHQVNSYSAREVDHFGAPSLITRITNDVQQVQMLVVLACTMMIAAPITMVFGIVFAIREDAGLSVIMLVAIPILIGVLAMIITRMVPTFQQMQLRVDRVNAVLRDQITGIRVVRAFVREPVEVERFAVANDELTKTSLRAGRLMALMFPTVTLFISFSSVAVLWFGAVADRVGADGHRVRRRLPELPGPGARRGGHGHVHGVDAPRAVRRRRTHRRGPRHRLIGHPTRRSDHLGPRARNGRLRGSRVHLPRRGACRCCPTSRSRSGRAGPRRSSAVPARASRPWSTSSRASSMRPPAPCRSTASTSAGSTPTCSGVRSVTSPRSRTSSPGPSPRTCASVDPTPRRRVVGSPRSGAGCRVRPIDAEGPRQPDHPGRDERVGWATPAPVDRTGLVAAPGPLRLRRLVLGARSRHRRPVAARPAAPPRRRRADRRPTRIDHRRCRPDHRPRTRPRSWVAAATSPSW